MLSLRDEKPRIGTSKRIGELLITEHLINEPQLAEALARQRSRKDYRPLGEICTELGFVTKRDLRAVLSKYQKQIFLGDLLVRSGLLTEAQLREALHAQRVNGKKLGEILVQKRFLTETALRHTLGRQLTVEKNDPDNKLVDRALLKEVNASFLRRKRVLPLFHDKEEGVLTVIMDDPMDAETIADLEKMFKTRVEPTILTSGAVEHLLNEILDVWVSSLR